MPLLSDFKEACKLFTHSLLNLFYVRLKLGKEIGHSKKTMWHSMKVVFQVHKVI